MNRFAALLLLVGASCFSPAKRPRDVLLVSLDTVRADALDEGMNGEPPVMPRLRQLAEESTWFRSAYSSMPFTLPAHMTLLTALHHQTHYVTIEKNRLEKSIPTLAEVLAKSGYRTRAFVTSSWLKAEFGFDHGFETYEELPVELTFAPRLRQRVLEALTRKQPDHPAPVFVFAHFYDAHADFSSTASNALSYYSPPEYRQDLVVPPSAICSGDDVCATSFLLDADLTNREVDPAVISVHRELYRRGLRYLDDQIALLLADLRSAGVLDDVLLVIVSDHGEEFREHGRFLHSQVYEESLRVPLVMRFPPSPPTIAARLCGLEDVAPSILGRLGIPAPSTWQGRDLLAPDSSSEGRPRLIGQDKLVRSIYSVRTAEQLLVWDFATAAGRLFNRIEDPAERFPLPPGSTVESALRDALFSELRQLRSRRPDLLARPDLVFDESERATLRSLGYL